MTIVVEENVLSEDAVELDEDFQKYKQKIEPFKSGMARSPFFFFWFVTPNLAYKFYEYYELFS